MNIGIYISMFSLATGIYAILLSLEVIKANWRRDIDEGKKKRYKKYWFYFGVGMILIGIIRLIVTI